MTSNASSWDLRPWHGAAWPVEDGGSANSWRYEIMQAHVGDELIVRGHRMGQPDRAGQVLEARGPGDTQPFLVRWDDNGHTTLFYPSTDCVVRELSSKTGK